MFDPKDYAKGMLAELQEGADGISSFIDAYEGIGLFSGDEWHILICANERAHGFADGFKCCLEMWPVPTKKEAADD